MVLNPQRIPHIYFELGISLQVCYLLNRREACYLCHLIHALGVNTLLVKFEGAFLELTEERLHRHELLLLDIGAFKNLESCIG